MTKQPPNFEEVPSPANASTNVAALVTGDPRETDPVERTHYEIYCVCSDVKSLVDKFDSEDGIEAFFTQQTADELNLAAARLASIVDTITARKLVTYKGK